MVGGPTVTWSPFSEKLVFYSPLFLACPPGAPRGELALMPTPRRPCKPGVRNNGAILAKGMIMNDSRSSVSAHAQELRALAGELGNYGVGERWQGPARRHCEIQLVGLERELFSIARQLDVTAQYAGVHSVRATV